MRAGRSIVAGIPLVLCSIGAAQARIDVTFDVPQHGVAFGELFELEVVRTWAFVEPDPFDDHALAPLTVQLKSAVAWPLTGSHGTVHEPGERRRYLARAYVVGELRLPRIDVRERGIVVGSCTPQPLAVRSILPEPPGDIEWPGDVRELPRRGGVRWWMAGLLAALVGGVWWWRRPQPSVVAVRAVPAAPTHERTLVELAAMQLPGNDATAIATFYTQLAEILRGHCERRFGVRAAVRTSEELVVAVPLGADALARCLLACDLVKFAAVRPARAQHPEALACATDCVRATIVAEAAP